MCDLECRILTDPIVGFLPRVRRKKAGATFLGPERQTVRKGGNEMKSAKNLIAGFALITGLVGLAAPASAAWYYDRDRKELDGARQELRHDFRSGAGPHEIARDRAAIARERREVWADSRDWRYDRRYRDYHYRPWYRR
jgi:hypothetical protein